MDIDVTKSKEEKILEVLEFGKNSYFIKSENNLAKIRFVSTNRTKKVYWKDLCSGELSYIADKELEYI